MMPLLQDDLESVQEPGYNEILMIHFFITNLMLDNMPVWT